MVKGDVTHINSIRYVTPEIANTLKIAKPGDLLIGSYRTGAIMILDPEQEKIIWLQKGQWGTVHNTKPLPNGNLLFFDNRGKEGIEGRSSRVLEYNPITGAFPWQYEGTPEHPLFSFVRGAAQPLKNDNILITESDGGRLIEITRKGKIVWEYYTPQRAGPNGELIGVLDDAVRYEIQDLPFLEEH
jgi:hypothetical protein